MKIELILAIYASVISTLVLVWRMFTYLNDRKTRLHVTQKMMTKFYANDFGAVADSLHRTLDTVIVNKGWKPRYIERPLFKLNKKAANHDTFSAISKEEIHINYPRPIQPGEKIVYSAPIEGILNKMQETNGATKVKSIVQDTHGKTFSSKWMRLSSDNLNP